ncbi:MAG: 3-hydroxyacyl-CoA dehydrogenase family protein [Bacillota bacterium]
MVQVIEKVCVLGAGTMGKQIALCAAMAGYSTGCVDPDPVAVEKAVSFAETYFADQVKRGKMSQESALAGQNNIRFTTKLEEAAADADLVIESVPEVLELKRNIFSRLDKICLEKTILVTNSSFIPSSRIADATGRPGKVCNMHFFTPPIVMKPVEVVKGPHTSVETAQTVAGVCRSMGKFPIMLEKEIHGLLVNRVLDAILRESLFLLDMGVASFEDIDTAVSLALGHRIPPFRVMDLIGLDVVNLIFMEHYRETGDPRFKPSPSVVELVTQNRLGRKNGRGFYDYGKMMEERGY